MTSPSAQMTIPLTDTRPAVAIETHGCKLNQADTSRLAREFTEAGFRLVSTNEPADVYIVNTCTVTHIADRKARHALRAARRLNPGATIVATGCYAQRSPEELRELDEVDIVAGNADKPSLVRQIVEWRGEPPVACAVGVEADVLSPRIIRTRATVKIQEGCNQVCAYCIVPKVRGRERSIPPDAIIAEINRYASLGYKEVVLTGTQLGSYGFDLNGMSLRQLLERTLAETGVARLRVSSLQPQEMDADFLSLWADKRLCPHFHMPLQSGSDAVLKRMRRRYTAHEYGAAAELIRSLVPAASITADAIVGFPGETNADFANTYDLCQRVGFADMHVFPYSVRPGTSAAHFDSQIAPGVKSARMQALLELAEASARKFRESMLDSTRPVLWENTREVDGVQMWSGLTDNYVRVMAASEADLANQVTDVQLSFVEAGVVYGDVV